MRTLVNIKKVITLIIMTLHFIENKILRRVISVKIYVRGKFLRG